MPNPTRTSLDQAIELVDDARRQMEVESTALHRFLNAGAIQLTDYTKRRAELREGKVRRLKAEVEDALGQTYSGSQINQARYLKAAYEHLATGNATIEAFAWKDAQLTSQLHSKEACRRERNKERDAIEREARALTRQDLFPSQVSSRA